MDGEVAAWQHLRAMGLLDGKVVVVTGAGGGIGRAEALLFASEGARVVVNDLGGARDGVGSSDAAARRVVAEIEAAGGVAVASFDSVATPEGAARIVAQAVEAFGRLDVLVNNAGILRDKSIVKMTEEMWDSVVDVHLKGTFLCSQAAAKQMMAQGEGGRIVNTTSVSGMLGNFGQANYAAAKAGVAGMTRSLARELGGRNITVNCVAPGFIDTDMTRALPEAQRASLLAQIPLGRLGAVEDIAAAVAYLASPAAGYVTGTVLHVNGGMYMT